MDYIITDDQIDSAYRSIRLATANLQAVMYHLLGHYLGINRCPVCSGAGEITENYPLYNDLHFPQDCSACNGHGWTKDALQK